MIWPSDAAVVVVTIINEGICPGFFLDVLHAVLLHNMPECECPLVGLVLDNCCSCCNYPAEQMLVPR